MISFCCRANSNLGLYRTKIFYFTKNISDEECDVMLFQQKIKRANLPRKKNVENDTFSR